MVVAVLAANGGAARAPAQDASTAVPPHPTAAAPETARFAVATSPMTIDGRLDEASWSAAAPVTRFFEIYPANLGVPPADTEVRFLYDDDNVYVGVRAYDPQPEAIRAPLAKRDQMSADQDYAEIFLDTMNARRSALVFRTNARGIATDAQFNEDTQASSLAPDFDFDVRTSMDDSGWSAEFRIPLSTLRYQSGSDRAWSFVVVRGYPRSEFVRMASAPIPRGANCQLCFAAEVRGISLPRSSVPLSVTPQAAYYRSEAESGGLSTVGSHVRAGLDVRWQPRPDSIVDFTVQPDFSQVEADAVQLSVNTRFALFVPEKRPFFLEGVDLLSTPIAALYTRSVTDPEFGVRVTHRGDGRDFTLLAVGDAGGGSIVEPGTTGSQLGEQDFESIVIAGRYRQSAADTTFSLLGTARVNDENSGNFLLGGDAVWSPSQSDRLVAQLLWSRTRNPDRPDLLPDWTGQELAGAAGTLRWVHRDEDWYADVSHERLSREFRAWNGFVPQVGIARSSAGGGLNFYPHDSLLIRVSPNITFARTDTPGGGQIDGSASYRLQLDAPLSTSLTLEWLRQRELAPHGLEPLDSATLSLSTSPVPWLPSIGLFASRGDGIDFATGRRGRQTTLSASLSLRLLERFDVNTTLAHQELDAPGAQRLITDTVGQVAAIWHFSSRVYAQLLHQQANIVRSGFSSVDVRSESRFSSLLVGVQTNWQTRFFVGASKGSSSSIDSLQSGDTQAEVFAKFTYAFAVDGPIPQRLRAQGR